MKNQVFWDLDGTLFDTYPGMVEAFDQALLENGLSEIELDPEEVYALMRQHSFGTALKKTVANFGLDAARIQRSYDRLAAQNTLDAPLIQGVNPVLEAVVANGGRNFLLTHRKQFTEELMNQAQISALFSGVVTGNDPYPRKPAPDSLNALINQYQVDRQAAVMVGDRDLDVEAGHHAGIAGVLFDPDHLIESHSQPEARITLMAELPAFLQLT